VCQQPRFLLGSSLFGFWISPSLSLSISLSLSLFLLRLLVSVFPLCNSLCPDTEQAVIEQKRITSEGANMVLHRHV